MKIFHNSFLHACSLDILFNVLLSCFLNFHFFCTFDEWEFTTSLILDSIILSFFDASINVFFRSFQTRYSSFQTRYSSFQTRYSSFQTRYSSFQTRYSSFKTRYSNFQTRYSSFKTRISSFQSGEVELVRIRWTTTFWHASIEFGKLVIGLVFCGIHPQQIPWKNHTLFNVLSSCFLNFHFFCTFDEWEFTTSLILDSIILSFFDASINVFFGVFRLDTRVFRLDIRVFRLDTRVFRLDTRVSDSILEFSDSILEFSDSILEF